MKSLFIIFVAVGLGVASASATEPDVIGWKDLQVTTGYADPFKELEPQQLRDLGHLVRLRSLMAAEKIPSDGDDAREACEIEKRLRGAKIDIEWLLSQRRAVRRMREEQGKAVQTKLENEKITLAGFVIPLKREGGLVNEFLLVPAFDFCCRVVPPPPNQTIYVRSDDGIAMPSRFAAALISGTISAKQTKWNVQRDDRAVEFVASYSINPSAVQVHAAQK